MKTKEKVLLRNREGDFFLAFIKICSTTVNISDRTPSSELNSDERLKFDKMGFAC